MAMLTISLPLNALGYDEVKVVVSLVAAMVRDKRPKEPTPALQTIVLQCYFDYSLRLSIQLMR